MRGSWPRVEAVLFHGPDAAVTVRLRDGTTIAARVPGHAVPTIGEDVPVTVEGAVLAFAI